MKRLLALFLLAFTAVLHADTPPTADTTTEPAPIPFAEIGAKATADYKGDAIGISASAEGAQLRTGFQKLAGTVTNQGLALESTEAEGGGLRLRASALGRGAAAERIALPATGTVMVGKKAVIWSRPGLVEEYSVGVDGVRQDFIVAERPAGEGKLGLELALSGATAETAADGVKLTLDGSGRVLAYNRLSVTDATGRALSATLEVLSPSRLAVRVEDAGAVYPVRIDPTFSDADWVSLNPGIPGADSAVNAMVVDGSGNLYVGGSFTFIGTVAANRIAKWNGSAWSALGTGMNNTVFALAVSGSALYAGGDFTTAGGTSASRIAKWNGSAWSALGTVMNNTVFALAVSGSDLYAGGSFRGTSANRIAKWDGSAWSALGTGMNNSVRALAVSGSNLYAGGDFTTAGGTSARSIAKWNGSSWSALGTGMDGSVRALAVSGSDLYAGGDFFAAGGTSATIFMAKWNGSAWSALGTGMDGSVRALVVSGSDLYAAGDFSTAGDTPANCIAKWNGSAWSAFGTGIYNVRALVVSGSDLYAGGDFSTAGDTMALRVAKWNGSAWSALGTGMMDSNVRALAVIGSDLYAGGFFTTAGGTSANGIAKWDGSAWSALGAGMNGEVRALVVIGSDLYAGGGFTTAGGTSANRIAKWNGSAWSALGTGLDSNVNALAVIGSDLYAGGDFTHRIAKWDGSAWSALGTGLNSNVNALVVSGSDLYAGGDFTTAGGTPANRIAKWNGSAWSALDTGMNADVSALVVIGSDLYAGGFFTTAGGTSANGIAKWDGSAWSVLGTGMNGDVSALVVIGSDLYAGGGFTTAGGTSANRIAKWDGSAWSALGTGMNSNVAALAADSASHLYVGGSFTLAGTTASPYITQANLASAPAPTVTSISPTSGSAGGGTSVTITGTGFTGATSVTIGGTAATSVSVVSDTSITCTTPAGSVGTASVLVTTPGGTNAANTLYTYVVSAPAVVTLAATSVTATSAVLNGTVNALGDSTAVSFDLGLILGGNLVYVANTAGTPTPVTGSTAVDVTDVLPSLSPGVTYHFRVNGTNAAGTTNGNDLTFTTLSTNADLSDLSTTAGAIFPSFGSAVTSYASSVPNATTSVTVTPTVAQANATVTVNGVTVASGSASGPIALNFGSNAIMILVTAQDGSTTKTTTLTVTRAPAAPTVTAVSPTSGTTSGGTSVTLTGTNFTGATSVTFGGVAATSVVVSDATTITAVTPAGTAGSASVLVTTPGGSNAANTLFTYVAPTAPVIATATSASITATSATLGGNVTSDAGAAITERGVVYSVTTTNPNPMIGGSGVTKVIASGTTGVFTAAATSLSLGTGYSFKAYATNSVGTTYTTVSTFTTTGNVAPSFALPTTMVASTFVGSVGSTGGADGTGSVARFRYPQGAILATGGDLIVADTENHTIRRVTPAGVVTTIGGLAGTSGSTDATGTASRFYIPCGITQDSAGNFFIADSSNHTIRKMTPGGVVTTFAGTAGAQGNTNGNGAAARFKQPNRVAIDGAGNLYIADQNNNAIRKINPSADVTTFATGFNNPLDVTVDSAGYLYVADYGTHTIKKVTPAGVVSVLAGQSGLSGSADGTGTAASFNHPRGVVVDSSGNVFVGEDHNHTIRKITPAGVVTTIAGLAGVAGSTDGAGSVARFYRPLGVSLGAAGSLYVMDNWNQTIRKLTPQPVTITVAANAGAQTYTSMAMSISPGPANESAQTVAFNVTNTNNALFSVQPAMSSSGNMTYTPAGTVAGSATVSVTAQDNGGTSGGGIDTSSVQTFTITVTPAVPTVSTPTSASIAATSAALGGNVTSNGGATITERGVVYSVTTTNADPLIGGTGVTKVTASGTTGVFTAAVSVSGGGGYSFKAYATNSVGTTYTSVSTFSTPAEIAAVSTPTSASIAGTSATLGGNVTSDGGATITERGVVYSVTTTNPNPMIGGSGVTRVTATGTTGVFTTAVTGLSPSTGYSFAAYATNSIGTTYTSPVSTFSTLFTIWSSGTNTVTAGSILEDTHVYVTGGTNTVQGGATRGTLSILGGGLGLEFDGTGSPTITLNSDAAQAGNILLNGNVSVLAGSTSGTAQILNGGSAANSGYIDLSGGTRTFTVADGSAATDLLISAPVTNGSLTKAGAGTMTLSGANTYTGATTVSAGTLALQNSNASTSYSIAGGATLEINNASGRDMPTATFSGTGTLKKTGAGQLYWDLGAATFALGSGSTIDVQAGTFTGGSSGNEVWTSNLSNLNVASGATFDGVEANVRVNALTGSGTIKSGYSSSGNITFGVDNGGGTFSGVLASSVGAGSYTKAGTGTQILTGANTYTGATTVSGGTLQIGAGSTTGSLSTSSVITNNATLAFNRSNTVTQGTDFASVISGSGTVTQAGSGTLVLSGTNTYTGATTVSTGVLNIQNANALGTTAAGTSVTSGAALQIQGSITTAAEALSLNGTGISSDGALRNISGTNNFAGLVTLGSATRINSDAGTLTLSNAGTITGSGRALTIGGAGDTIINSVIGTGTGTLTKDGAGTLTLNGVNTYTGLTDVKAGTLVVGPADVFPETAVLRASGGTVSIGSDGERLGGIQLVSGSITGTTGKLLSNSTYDMQSGSLSAILEGTVGMSKTTSGTVIISSANLFTGATTISAGTLQIGAGGTTGSLSTSSSITNNGTLAFNRSDTLTQGTDFGTVISGSGGVTQAGSGNLVLSGTNTYTGATLVSAGTLTVNGSIATSSLTTINGGALTGTGTVGAVQLNSAGAVNVGAGTLTTGNIAITNGQLVFSIGGTSNYGHLNTNGTINLTNGGSGAQLVLNAINGYIATKGDTFTLITNDLTDAISGNFAGLTEGKTIPNFLGTSLTGKITYVGGTGNDVVVTVLAAPPAITSLNVTSGSTAGGTAVTITGTDFTGATGVTFGGAAATSVTVVNDTTITAVTPAGSAGSASVVVTTPSGSNTANSLYTFANTAPTLAAINKSGLEDTTVNFTAANFTSPYSDLESDALSSITVATLPATGTLKLSGTNVTATQVIPAANLGNLTYVPAANENGVKTFTVTASDGSLSSTAATVTMTLTAVNDAPGYALAAGAALPAGTTWTARDSSRAWQTVASSSDGTKLAAAVSGGLIYTSTDSGATWTPQASSGSRGWNSIASSSDGTKLAAVVSGGGIYTSTDSGVTWTLQAGAGSRNWAGIASSADGTKLVAGGYFINIYTSTDSGVTWTARDSARQWAYVTSSSDGTKLAMVEGGGSTVWTSSDSGVTWTPHGGAGPAGNLSPIAGSADGTKLVTAAAQNGTIYTSTNSGTSWTSRAGQLTWNALASSADGIKLFAAVQNGQVYTSTDSGVTWAAQSGGGTRNWTGLACSSDGSKLVGVVGSGQIYTSAAGSAPYAVTLAEDAGAQSIPSVATSISAGPQDESSQTVSFTVTSTNNLLFSSQPAIDASGTLTFTSAANANGSATVSVTAVDDGGTGNGGVNSSAAQTFTLTVTPVNDTPTDIALSATTIAENNAANATVGPLSTTDVDVGDTSTCSLATGTGSTDNGSFTISGTSLKLTPSANYEVKNSYAVRVRTTDAGGLFFEKAFTISVTNVNEAPTGIDDGSGGGGSPGVIVWETPETFNNNPSQVRTNGLRHAAISFSNSDLTVNGVVFDHFTGGSSFANSSKISIDNRTDYYGSLASGGSGSYGQMVSTAHFIGVTPANITISGLTPGQTYQVQVFMPFWDSDYPAYYSSGGTSVLLHNGGGSHPNPDVVTGTFVASGTTQVITRTPSSYWASLAAISVRSAGGLTLAENNDPNAAVATLTATGDPDVGDTFTYSLVTGTGSTDNASFNISGSTLRLTGVADYETKSSYSVRVRATDAGGLFFEKALTISINNVNEAPTLTSISKSGTEDTTLAFTLANFTASFSDPESDALASITVVSLPATGTLKLSGSDVSANQTISASNIPSLTYLPAANENGAKTFTVKASDGSLSSRTVTVTMTLAPVNDAPTLDGAAGGTWAARDSSRSWTSAAASADGTKLVAAARFGDKLYTSTDSGTTWTARDSNRDWISVASSAEGTKLIAANQNYPGGGSLYTSTDSGLTWTPRSGAGTRVWLMVASSTDGTKLVAAAQGSQLYTSTDSGVTWTARATSQNWFAVASSADGTKLAAAVQSGGLYTSTDSGVTWTLRSAAGTLDFKSIASSADGTKLVAAADSSQLLTSTDSGVTWTSRESARSWRSVASSSDGVTLLACDSGGELYLSTNSGVTWSPKDSSRAWNGVAMSANAAVMVGAPGGDNLYVSKSPLAPLAIDEDAAAQTVNLAGITSGAANESQTLTVTATSSNPSIIPNPTVTYASADTTGSLSFTPVANANGVVTITVTVTDDATAGGSALSTSQTFTVTVNPVNDAPTLTSVSTLSGGTEDTGLTISYATLAAAADEADVDGDALSFRVESVSSGTLTKGGVAVTTGTSLLSTGEEWVWTPAADANGVLNAFTVKVYDNALASATAVQVSVDVAAVNDAPVITSNGGGASAAVSVVENTSAVTTVTATDVEVPATQTLAYSKSGADATLFTINRSTGELSFTNAPNYEVPLDAGHDNVYNVTVIVSDNGTPVLSDSQAFSIAVTNVEDVDRSVDLSWNQRYAGPNATPRNGDAKAVALQYTGTYVEAVFATGFTTNAAGNHDVYVMKYDPTTGQQDPVWKVQADTMFNGAANLDDEGSALVVDSNGDVIVAGLTTLSASNTDVWVAKYNGATGVRLWTHTFNGALNNADWANDIAVNAAGVIAVAGGTVTASGNYDMYVARLNPSTGAAVWEKALDGGNSKSDIANKVAVDATGNVFVAGYMGNASNKKVSYAAKLSAAAGTLQWSHARVGAGASLDDMLTGLKLDAAGNPVVVGSLYGAGNYDLYAAKLDTNSAGPAATLLWEKVTDPYGNNDSFYDVIIDGEGNVVAAGASRGPTNVFERVLTKYNGTTGATLWDTHLNQGLSGVGTRAFTAQLGVDGENNVVTAGFGISPAGDGTLDVYTAKLLRADGGVIWEKSHPVPAVAGLNDEARDVAVSANGDAFVVGYSADTAVTTVTDFLVLKYGAAAAAQQLANPIVFTTSTTQSVGTTVQVQATAPGGQVRYSLVSGPATLSGGNSDMLTFTGIGTVVVRGKQSGSSQYAAATDTDLSITVVPGSQTISFSLASTSSYLATVDLTATATSGLGVTYSVQSGPGSISGAVLSFSNAGDVVVRASQAGNTNYNAATPVERTITATNDAPVIILPGIEQSWAAVYPGTGAGQARAVVLDTTGGTINGVVTTGSTTRSGTGLDLRTAKYDSTGALVWETIRAVNLADEGAAVQMDASGNVYVAGYTTVAAGNTDVLVIKYNSAGVQQWQRTFSGTASGGGADTATTLKLTTGGDIIVAGSVVNTVTVSDYFAARVDTNGNVIWSQSYDGGFNKPDVVNGLALDASNNPVLAGYSQNAAANEDCFTVKVPAAGGTALWSRRFGGALASADRINAVTLDADGNVLVTGYTQAASIDLYTAKYVGATGSVVWENLYNGPASKNDAAYDIKVDSAGDAYVASTSSDINAVNDALTLKLYGTTGVLAWATRYNGAANKTDRMTALGFDPFGNIIASGYTLGSNSTSDIYTAKYDKNTGSQIWGILYNGADGLRNDNINAMVTDSLGGAWVAGFAATTGNVNASLLLRLAPPNSSPPPAPPPPPPAFAFESDDSESQAADLQAAPPPPATSLNFLNAYISVEQGDNARFNAQYFDADSNNSVNFEASSNGQSAGVVSSDPSSGTLTWNYDTSTTAPGSHEVIITATDTGGASSGVKLTVNIISTRPDRAWLWQNFGTTVAAGLAADGADPDGDGVSNLAEFAFGLNPNAASSHDTGTRAEAAATGQGMSAIFRRRKDYANVGLNYTVEFSRNLSDWFPGAAVPNVLADEGALEQVSVQFPLLPDGTPSTFFRIRIKSQSSAP